MTCKIKDKYITINSINIQYDVFGTIDVEITLNSNTNDFLYIQSLYNNQFNCVKSDYVFECIFTSHGKGFKGYSSFIKNMTQDYYNNSIITEVIITADYIVDYDIAEIRDEKLRSIGI